jgi:hypothetical protein
MDLPSIGSTGTHRRYLPYMTAAKSIASLGVPVMLLSALVLAAPATSSASSTVVATSTLAQSTAPAQSPAERSTEKTTAAERALLQSPLLWATVDVCNPSDQPNTVGVRGSMPGDNHAKDEMYMRFRLQYLDSSTKLWVDLTTGADSGYVAVGAAKSARQAGFSFQLTPVAGKPAFMLRGVVSFQWRRNSAVVYTVSRPTTAKHKSLSGADPAGFSTAECSLS